jgi:calcineurin-like phosphoesterase family protein
MRTFFTSDTHFGDHRAINIRRRPFRSVADMNDALIRLWNLRVRPRDEVWHLGDFAAHAKTVEAILPRLNGRKHLILGNLDEPDIPALGWSSVQAYSEIRLDGIMVVLCHYPFRTWNGIHRGSINLHGHSHGRLKPLTRPYDVGVDSRSFRPVLLADLLAAKNVVAVRWSCHRVCAQTNSSRYIEARYGASCQSSTLSHGRAKATIRVGRQRRSAKGVG